MDDCEGLWVIQAKSHSEAVEKFVAELVACMEEEYEIEGIHVDELDFSGGVACVL